MIKESGTLHVGSQGSIIELDIDLSQWRRDVLQDIELVREQVKEMVFQIGFMIEARREEELPEQLLGACALARVNFDDPRLPFITKRSTASRA